MFAHQIARQRHTSSDCYEELSFIGTLKGYNSIKKSDKTSNIIVAISLDADELIFPMDINIEC